MMKRPVCELTQAGGAGQPPKATGSYHAEVVSGLEALEKIEPEWRALQDDALSANWVSEARWAIPGVRHLLPDQQAVQAILVRYQVHPTVPNEHGSLVGVFLQLPCKHNWGMPLPISKTWQHDFAVLGTPLLHRDHAQEALQAFFDWFDHQQTQSRLLLLRRMPEQGAFFDILQGLLEKRARPWRRIGQFERAIMRTELSVSDYVQQTQSRKRRKEFRRLRARLGELGKLESMTLAPGEDYRPWMEQFYALEARGWKGRRETALSCNDENIAFFDEGTGNYAKDGDLLFWKLTLDGTPIAMTFGFKSGQQAWLLKIAYDEDFSKFSPGALIIFDVMETIASMSDVDWIDSCANADHPMINHIWRERLALTDILIGQARLPNTVFFAAEKAEHLGRRGREKLKEIYNNTLRRGRK